MAAGEPWLSVNRESRLETIEGADPSRGRVGMTLGEKSFGGGERMDALDALDALFHGSSETRRIDASCDVVVPGAVGDLGPGLKAPHPCPRLVSIPPCL